MQNKNFKNDEYIICAAIHYDNGLKYPYHEIYGIETGFVLAGYRHPHIISVLPTNPHYIKKKIEENDTETIQKYGNLNVKYGWHEDSLIKSETTQGFLTNKGRFVNRKEAFEIAWKAGQLDSDINSPEGTLFSEDLY